VGLLSERGIDLIVAAMAIFKAGGAYLPIDPSYPRSRYRQLIDQSHCTLVIAERRFKPSLLAALEELSRDHPQVLELEQLFEQEASEEELPSRCTPNNLAYVSYTSGSSGVPKGAMIEHAAMLNHLLSKIKDLEITTADVV